MDDLIKKAEELLQEKTLEEGKGLLDSNPLLQQAGQLFGRQSAPAAPQGAAQSEDAAQDEDEDEDSEREDEDDEDELDEDEDDDEDEGDR